MTDNAAPIGGTGGVQPPGIEKTAPARVGSLGTGGPSFEEVLRSSIQSVDEFQSDAESAIQETVVGDRDSVAEVMTAVEKADLAFRTLMQVRNKLVDAYEELLRMRI